MPRRKRRSLFARLLAPLALVVVAGAVAGVILNSNIAGGNGEESSATDTGQAETETTATERERPRRRRYIIKAGDTLGGIAEKTGVSVERLERLNPELDPQALVAGQRIQLRE